MRHYIEYLSEGDTKITVTNEQGYQQIRKEEAAGILEILLHGRAIDHEIIYDHPTEDEHFTCIGDPEDV